MTGLRELLAVTPGQFRLADVDPRGTPGLPAKNATGDDPKGWSAEARSPRSGRAGHVPGEALRLRQAGRLRPAGPAAPAGDGLRRQGRHAAQRGSGLNPIGIKAVSFGPPTDEERQHDFLWRIRRALPPPGELGVFNRSHYEDVLVVRVHNLVPRGRLDQRYDQINAFEDEQAASGLTMVKVMLHISPEEQKERLLARLDDPTKHWKYNPGDLDERARWATTSRPTRTR